MGVHRPHRHACHLFLIVDHDNARFTIEGPLSDYLPWIREVERARGAGRQIDFRILRKSQAKIVAGWSEEMEYEKWPPGTIVDPFLGTVE